MFLQVAPCWRLNSCSTAKPGLDNNPSFFAMRRGAIINTFSHHHSNTWQEIKNDYDVTDLILGYPILAARFC
jgi:hypothetical protein